MARINNLTFAQYTQALLLFFAVALTGCASKPTVEPIAQTSINTATPLAEEVVASNDILEDDDALFEDDDLFADDELDELDEELTVEEDSDPLYYFNVAMFHFNDKLYFWVLKPTATAYKAVTPQFFRTGVNNFFHNLAMPVRLTNNLLQGNFNESGTELGRFVVNTTVGVLGFMDPAEEYLDWQPSDQDLGITLGKYGIGNGPYVVWPLLGPSTVRDTVGFTGDFFLGFDVPKETKHKIAAQGLKTVNKVADRIGDYEAFKQAYIDPYERMKEFYLASRQDKVDELSE